jgi:UDP-glucose 4-epimerase
VPGPATYARPAPIRRAAVIGAAGFIGSRLTEALTAAGVDTAAFTRRCHFLAGSGLAYPMRRAEIIFYLASTLNPSLGEQHPERAVADHRLFAELLSRLAEQETTPTVVLTSSGGTVYDERVPPPYTELSPVRATRRYGQAKLALERELCRHAHRIPGVILRLSNAYGPRQPTGKGQGVLAYWLRAAAEGTALRVIGDPECARDYVYIDDVVDCMTRLVGRPAAPGRSPLVLNVGSGTPTTLTELLDVTRRVVGRELPVERLPARRLDRRTVWLQVDRARDVLGWRPRTSLEEGVARMWRRTLKHGTGTPRAMTPKMPLLVGTTAGMEAHRARRNNGPGRAELDREHTAER